MRTALLYSNTLTHNVMFDSFEQLGVGVSNDQLYKLTLDFLKSLDKNLMDVGSPAHVGMNGAALCHIYFKRDVARTVKGVVMGASTANSMVNVLTCVAYGKDLAVKDLLDKFPTMYNDSYVYFNGKPAVRKVEDIQVSASEFLEFYRSRLTSTTKNAGNRKPIIRTTGQLYRDLLSTDKFKVQKAEGGRRATC